MLNTGQMDLPSLAMDNIDEILLKVVEFTRLRHEIISENIKKCHISGFMPSRVNSEEFAMLITAALSEHLRTSQLVFRDGSSVSFGNAGGFTLSPEADTEAAHLKSNDRRGYILLQRTRLRENMVNNRLAVALLEHKAEKSARQAS